VAFGVDSIEPERFLIELRGLAEIVHGNHGDCVRIS
jgi:hypothetical protein